MFLKIRLLTLILLLAHVSAFSQFNITGKIVDDQKAPLPGATIEILNTSKGAVSAVDGRFAIDNLKPGAYFLKISFVGFQDIQRKVDLIDESIDLELTMRQAQVQLNEIIVTADRRLRDIQKTAASVSALESKQIEQLQVKQFSELNSIAPNFRSYDDGSTGSFTLIASRGISTIDFTPSVGLYIDDVPYFTTYAFPLSLTDVEQIEILRGPQGTLYGRNALAGVIKVTSKSAKNQVGGFATAGIGNLGSQEYGLGINVPIVKDKLYFRGNANYTNRDGFVTNTFLNKDLQDRQTLDANMRLKYQASDRLSISLQYSLQDRESDAYVFLSATPDNDFQDILENSLYRVSYNEDVNREVITHNVAASVLYDFDKFTLNAVTAYQYTDQQRRDEFDFTEFDIQSAFGENLLANLSQEIRLSTNNAGKFNWTGGVFLYRLDHEIDDNLRTGVDAAAFDPFAPYVRRDLSDVVLSGLAFVGLVD
ncbi:MAG: TonB-dependent receptor [Bacteroidota bacterium]